MATAGKTTKKAAVKPSDESRMQKIADGIQSTAEKLRDKVKHNVHDSSVAVRSRTMGVTIALIKLQRSAFDRSFKALSSVQKYSDKLVKRHLQDAAWMPKEGKDIVKEWSQMLNEGRADFQNTVDKSYDLLTDCLERIRKEPVSIGKKKVVTKTAMAPKAKITVKANIVAKKRRPASASAVTA
jgi:hypothetical protein